MQKGLVSIITPVYNAQRFIPETIESVLAQTYTSWEMIIIDDGSKDDSVAVISEYVKKDNRISVFSQPNGGSAAARNNGIRRANGQYIALLDADDLWDADFLEKQLALMKAKNATLVYGSHRRIDEHSKECMRPFVVPEKVDYNSLLKTCSISCLTAVYDTSRFGKMYLREDLKSLRDDYAFWLTIIKQCKEAYGNKEVLASYRVLSNSTTGKKKKVIKPQFLVYYKIEKLGLIRSCYYLIHWALNGFAKYRA